MIEVIHLVSDVAKKSDVDNRKDTQEVQIGHHVYML